MRNAQTIGEAHSKAMHKATKAVLEEWPDFMPDHEHRFAVLYGHLRKFHVSYMNALNEDISDPCEDKNSSVRHAARIDRDRKEEKSSDYFARGYMIGDKHE